MVDPTSAPADLSPAQAVLQRVFGYGEFRAGQADAVATVLRGGDAVVLLPTGAGKSVCYQVPAIMLHAAGRGTTVVVSPLVALMNDQVAALVGRGVAAAAVHSQQDPETQADAIARLVRGELALLYISPERAALPGFRRLLVRSRVAQLAIDEAHCVSQWGHDFRPDYMALGELRRLLPVPCMALTATATPRVLDEIEKTLALKATTRVRGGFARPNLAFAVRHAATDASRIDALLHYLDEAGLRTGTPAGRAIVYCSTRATVERVTEALRARGIAANHYHAGRTGLARERAERAFAKQKARVLVATNAFGMGVDYSDVRLVVHFGAPGSLEAYYQEAGRAGRDGAPAQCILFFGKRDIVTQQRLTSRTTPTQAARQADALTAITTYAHTWRCRQVQLCDYFGAALVADCSRCDVCTQPEGELTNVPLAAGCVLDEAVQRAIVDALRTTAHAVGKRALIGALRGSRAKQVASAGLLQATFHGSMAHCADDDLDATVEHLIAKRQLLRRGRKYPTLVVFGTPATPRRRFARGTLSPAAASDQPKPSVRSVQPAQRYRNLGVALELDTYRRATARKLKWKAYMVFQSAVIKAIDAARPESLEALAKIPGLGPAKLARFGEDILRIVRRG